ncbi:hypothetical protein BDV93DRAFT_451263 [Ceratobasidium sp. AG-I]|nr:hypothetical protein BDV93DRAFT_451263 [Ceratobasidium sp. AG-I]
MNCHLPPNFHQLIHLEEFILENGSLYNTHAWAFERANNDVTRINTNGHGNGVLEGTLMKGWWGSSQIQGLVSENDHSALRYLHIFIIGSSLAGHS